MAEQISQDRTFCKNRECNRTECDRHYSQIDWSAAQPWRSFADFDGTKYCLKVKGGERMTERERAIKEFAERLTAGLIEKGLYPVLIRNLIRDIAKEMGAE